MASDTLLPISHSVDDLCFRHRRLDSLLVRVGDGDRAAFAALYDELGPFVFAMSMREGQASRVTAQVTQYVFLRAWRQARSYDPQAGSAWAWLHDIALRATEGRHGHVF